MLWHEERWLTISDRLTELGLQHERFPAVDGCELTLDQLEGCYDSVTARRWRYNLSLPEVGCYLSHRGLWEKLLEGSDPGMVVMEDDARVSSDLPEVISSIAGMDLVNPVMVKLYWRRLRLNCRLHGTKLTDRHSLVVPCRMSWGTVAYYINRAAAERLTHRPRFFRPVDEDLRRYWETGVDLGVVDPMPVTLETEAKCLGQGLLERERRERSERNRREVGGLTKLAVRHLYLETFTLLHAHGRAARSLR